MLEHDREKNLTALAFAFFLSVTLIGSLIPKAYSQFLIISIYSSKQEYYLNDEIKLYGNLTHLGQSVYDGIVALQIISPENKTLTIRVASTGPVSQENYPVRITQFYPSDSLGNPKTTFNKGTFLYLTAYVVNNDLIRHSLYFAVNIYDKYGKPWDVSSSTGGIEPGETKFIVTGYPISWEFPSGTAVAYAVALTDEPKNNGVPHCPEAKATFQIATSEISTITTSTYKDGYFYLNFSMPTNSPSGNYTVHATSIYQYSTTTTQLNFKIRVPDLNNDGTVDIYDLIIVSAAYGSSEGSQNWNPIADINGDKTIDIYDLILVASSFGWKST